jgi:hypothetical protein
MHIPETPDAMAKLIQEMAYDVKDPDPIQLKHAYHYTATDHTNHACGIPYMSVMVMRNLARYAGKHGQPDKNGVPLMEKLFGGHRYKIFNMLGVNRTLREKIEDLVQLMDKGSRDDKRGVKRDHEDEEMTSG